VAEQHVRCNTDHDYDGGHLEQKFHGPSQRRDAPTSVSRLALGPRTLWQFDCVGSVVTKSLDFGRYLSIL
jgi:hypothetical protein